MAKLNTYTKDIVFKPVIDMSGIKDDSNKISKEFKKSSKGMKKPIIDNGKELGGIEKKLLSFGEMFKNDIKEAFRDPEVYQISKDFKEYTEALEKIKGLDKNSEKYEELLTIIKQHKQEYGKMTEQEAKSQYRKKNISKSITDNLVNSFDDGLKNIADKIKDTFKDIARNISDSLNEIAEYSLSETIKFNSEAYSQALKYGLDEATNYALSQVMKEMGISSLEEGVYYFNENQWNYFKNRMEYFSTQFESQKEVALEYQKFQIEFTNFKNQLQREVVDFFMNNKDEIKQFLKMSMSFMQAILQTVGIIARYLGSDTTTESDRLSKTSDIINQQSTMNTTNNNVKIDNSYNVQANDKMSIERAVKNGYAPLIAALTGR